MAIPGSDLVGKSEQEKPVPFEHRWEALVPRRWSGRTHYDVLEVSASAPIEQIEISFETLVRQLDQGGGSGKNHQIRRQQIEEAWFVLSDPGRRQRYDAKLQNLAPLSSTDGADNLQQDRSTELGVPIAPDYDGLTAKSEWSGALQRLRVRKGTIEFRPVAGSSNNAELRRRLLDLLPAREIDHDPLHQLWTIPASRLPELKQVFVNVDSLLAGASGESRPLELPDFTTTPDDTSVQTPSQRPTFGLSEYVVPTGQQPFNVIIVITLAIVVGWNFYVAADNRRAANVANSTLDAEPVPVITPVPIVQPTPTPSPVPTPVVIAARTGFPRVYLRSQPTENSTSLLLLTSSDELEVVGRTADSTWLRVRLGENIGWSAVWTISLGSEFDLDLLTVVDPR